jgi:hypothetical protein
LVGSADSAVPSGLEIVLGGSDPTLKCWAIVGCPSGTGNCAVFVFKILVALDNNVCPTVQGEARVDRTDAELEILNQGCREATIVKTAMLS